MKAHLKTFSNEKSFWKTAVNIALMASKKNTAPFRMALSGGSSADVLDFLKWQPEWHFYQVDERFVPREHSANNARLLKKKLQKAKNLYLFPILKNPEESATSYKKILQVDNQGFLFDLVVLGVGTDGHVASLFPFSPALDEEKELAVATQTDTFPICDRMTITFPALQRSRTVLILMQGAQKKKIFEKITNPETDFHEFPARKLLDWENAIFLFLS